MWLENMTAEDHARFVEAMWIGEDEPEARDIIARFGATQDDVEAIMGDAGYVRCHACRGFEIEPNHDSEGRPVCESCSN